MKRILAILLGAVMVSFVAASGYFFSVDDSLWQTPKAKANVASDQGTDMEASTTGGALGVTFRLQLDMIDKCNDELNAVKAREADAWAALAEAHVEIERLRNPQPAPLKHTSTHTYLGSPCIFPNCN